MNRKKILGFSGSAIMIVGSFMPIVSLPFGSITYFNNGQGDGVLILLLSAVAAVLTWRNLYKFLWMPGAVATVLMLFALSRFVQVMNEAKLHLSSMSGNIFSGLATGIMNSIQLQFGWVFLFVGSLALVAASFVPQPEMLGEDETPKAVKEFKPSNPRL